MKKLGDRNWALISMGVKNNGTFDPDEIMPFFMEALYEDEVQEIDDFLRWLHDNDKTMGHGNYEEVFTEWKESL